MADRAWSTTWARCQGVERVSSSSRAGRFRKPAAGLISLLPLATSAMGQTPGAIPPTAAVQPSTPASTDDGRPDLGGFLDKKCGFLPIGTLITEPAGGLVDVRYRSGGSPVWAGIG